MRIVHFHPDIRMARRFVRPLMDAERDQLYKTELVSSTNHPDSDHGHRAPFDISKDSFFTLPVTLWKIWGFIKKSHPDVLFAHNTRASSVPLLAAFLAGVTTRVYFNHGVPYIHYSGIIKHVLWLLERFNLLLSTHVITVSRDMKYILETVSREPRIIIIHNGSACGIDLRTFAESSYDPISWRKRLDINEDDLVVAYVGRPEIRKGFHLALHLWRDYFSFNNSFKLVICGPTLKDAYRYLSSLPSNITVLGFVDNVAEVLSGSDLLILPSKHEGLSYACLEAQACSAVPLANNVLGLRNALIDNVTGFLIENNNLEAYAEKINLLHQNREKLGELKKNGLKFAQTYSRDDFMLSYISWLRSLHP